jgi:hypothetical protein
LWILETVTAAYFMFYSPSVCSAQQKTISRTYVNFVSELMIGNYLGMRRQDDYEK